jgi:hypothetical protein
MGKYGEAPSGELSSKKLETVKFAQKKKHSNNKGSKEVGNAHPNCFDNIFASFVSSFSTISIIFTKSKRDDLKISVRSVMSF